MPTLLSVSHRRAKNTLDYKINLKRKLRRMEENLIDDTNPTLNLSVNQLTEPDQSDQLKELDN